MLRSMLLTLAIALPAGAATAQDIAPVISPGQAAEGIYYRSMMEQQAARDRARNGQHGGGTTALAGPTAAQRQACANRPRYRQQYGADHPKVRQLEALCAKAGL